ncbi:hypothetical protein H7I41_25470 [Mycobacterium manitobense]|uniref:Uncharacterized protein n=1 Tax=[Mycobacterium] manitobense TaxID=190147 RepID=A0A9X2YVQ1_9MYCO|nr:hypothetical protein [[Mycobacterium] manitobense]MCV7173277.1 hypothetical protein [[Mycobacterium] manitobense]
MTTTSRTATHRFGRINVHVRQFLVVTALVAGTAFGATPIVMAAPVEDGLDLDDYDRCWTRVVRDDNNEGPRDLQAYNQLCCQAAGGIWKPEDPMNCYAPPAERSPGDSGPVTGKPGVTPPQASDPGLAPVAPPPPPPAQNPVLAPKG